MPTVYNIIEKIGKLSPDFVGRLLINIPFKFRYGSVYNEFESKIKKAEKWNQEELENYIIINFNEIFQHAKKFKLYREKYKKCGVLDLKINSLDDIKKVPILTKAEIRGNFSEFKGYYTEKTSGTTGNPLQFYLDKNAWTREKAHIHHIWKKSNYRHKDSIFTLRDCNKEDKFIKYNFEQNEYFLNIYKIFNMTDENIDEFFNILIKRKVKYLYGYPSAINDFLKELEKRVSIKRRKILKDNIIGCFLGSEYPIPQVVDRLKKWKIDFISWYGHSEVCVLATTAKNKLTYHPFYTYGITEVENNMLLGTSYHNFDMPLIRYNTEDVVIAKRYSNGILKSFKIKDGRIGDSILDKNNFRIPLVRILINVNSDVFKFLNYIQAYQIKNGSATILISQTKFKKFDEIKLMNLEKYDIDFDFLYLDKPIKTSTGKVPMRVMELPELSKL